MLLNIFNPYPSRSCQGDARNPRNAHYKIWNKKCTLQNMEQAALRTSPGSVNCNRLFHLGVGKRCGRCKKKKKKKKKGGGGRGKKERKQQQRG